MSHAASTNPAIDERYERLPIGVVFPSKTNPRQHFDDAYLHELAGSIREKGVIQPILVRQTGKNGADRFEIVAGECRFRASKLAKQATIPAIIRTFTDEQVLELQLIENIHRQDLTPLEQARGYRALIDQNPTKHSVESIATRIGMSPAWVWDRIKLNDLVPKAKVILERELMTVGHAILIARLKPADQERVIDAEGGRNGYNNRTDGLWAFDFGGRLDDDDADDQAHKTDKYHRLKAVSVRELDHWIRDHIRFDVKHAAKAQPLQFEDVAAVVTKATAEPGRGKKVIAITHDFRVTDDARDAAERTYGRDSWVRADGFEKSKCCNDSVLGVVVAGRGQGETLQVCVNRDKCRVHFAKVIAGKGKQAAKRESAAWARQEQKRKADAAAWEALKPQACAAVAKLAAGVKFNAKLVERLVDFQSKREIEKVFSLKLTDKTAAAFLALATIDTYDADGFARDTKTLFGFDLKKFEARLASDDTPATKSKPAKKSKAA